MTTTIQVDGRPLLKAQLAFRLRRPLFGPHGRKVVAVLCGWELAALHHASPVPTLSATVRKYPLLGWLLLFLLTHHWYFEMSD